MGPFGIQELLIIGAVALLFFGPRNLPKLGRALGDSIREFKSAGKELQKSFDDDKD